MKTKRSTLIGLLSTLLVIVTVLSSVLVFTATAGSSEPEDASDDRYVYATNVDDLFAEVVNWYPSSWAKGATWKVTDEDGHGILLLDLNEIGDYDVVEIGIGDSSKSYLDFAFLSEAPVEGEKLALVGDVRSYNGGDKKKAGLLYYADIPEGANYLAIRARSGGWNLTCPRSIAFERTDSNLLNSSLDSYAYPMNKVVPSMAVITNKGKYDVVHNGDYSTALIPIEGTTFDAVTFRSNAACDTTTYAFLTEAPVPSGDVSFAGGMTATASAADGETVKIPEDAKYLAVLYKEWNYGTSKVDFYAPFSITFVNWAAIPSTATTKTVSASLEADGCIYGWDKDDNSHKWLETDSNGGKTGLIDLTVTDRDYAEVSFTVGSSKYLGYAFLNKTPVLGEKVSYTGGATAITEVTDRDKGTVVTVSIPYDATTIVVWMKDEGSSTNFAPSAISLTYEEEVKAPYGLELKTSAEARLNANSGLRFTTRIPTAELAGLDYTVGTLIFPTDALDGALTVDTEGALNIVMENGVAGNEYTYFTAAMTDIIAQNYAREFTAVSYIKVGGKYYYTAAAASSVYEAAVETHKANAEDANADAVRAYIDGVVVIENGKQVMPYDGYEHALTATYEFANSNSSFNLTVTGENLTVDSLKTVIIDGKIYTGGWELVDGKLVVVAAYSPMQDSSLSEFNYPMESITPADGCITYYLKDVKGLTSDEYKADPDCHMYVVSDEYSDYRIAFINIEGTVFTKAKFTGNKASYMGWFWLEEMPTLGEAINFAGGMQGILETPRGSGSQTGAQTIEPGSKVLAVVYQRPASEGTGVQNVLPEGILFLK